MFTPEGIDLRWYKKFAPEVGVSWLAVPMLDLVEGTKIHVVRNPCDTITSMLGMRWPGKSTPFARYAKRHWVRRGDNDLEEAAFFWKDWTEMAVDKCDLTVHIEGLEEETLWSLVMDRQPDPIATPVNRKLNSHRKDTPQVTWDQLPQEVGDWAKQLGYEEETWER